MHSALEHGAGVGDYLLRDRVECNLLRAAVVFDSGSDDAAGIGDEIRDRKDAALVHALLSRRGRGYVGALQNQSRLQRFDVRLDG